jgi:hypothetical protein
VACVRDPAAGMSVEDRPPVAQAGGPASLFPHVPVPGLEGLWGQTLGDPRVRVAVLDGPADLAHPALAGVELLWREGPAPSRPDGGPACRHGTRVASILFGRHGGPVPGVAPGCSGVLVPVFESVEADTFRACSQLDLARALTEAVLAGAHVINVSGGQFSPSGTAHPLLADVVADCARRGVLVVAAAGNGGCECPHVPAALDGVLAVGAMDASGEPLAFSNWAAPYAGRGVLAPGEHVLAAVPGGGREWVRGTSYAAALVSGVAALLLSLELRRGQRPDPPLVRAAILAAARRRRPASPGDGRYLSGPLDVRGAVSFLTRGTRTMAEVSEVLASDLPPPPRTSPEATTPPRTAPPQAEESARPRAAERAAEEKASTCSCGGGVGPRLVYALGQLGYDFPGEARLDSLAQKIAAQAGVHPPQRALAFDPRRLLAYLDKNPWDAASVVWTLHLDGTPLYAIRPQGPFAADVYRQLRQFLQEQLDEGVERVSVPGFVAGKATLLNGQSVPAVVPELRGMYSWTTAALADAVAGPAPAGADGPERDGHRRRRDGVGNFLARVYHEVRNLGLTPQDRALNYAATNAFEMGQVYADALRERMELDRIGVSPSPVGRPGSDCWDVEVYFFYPERQVQTVRKVYRFTVDVSDTVPVTVGAARSWFTR